jgi:acetyl-CoA synthetase
MDSPDSFDPTPRLDRFESYEQAFLEFELRIPQHLNIATSICRRHADAVTRIALLDLKSEGANTYTFGGLDYLSDKFAVALRERGISPGDRVAIALPQGAASAVTQLSVLKSGAVAVMVPASLSGNPGEWLESAASKALVTDVETRERLDPGLSIQSASLYLVGHRLPRGNYEDFWRLTTASSSDFEPVDTPAESPAFVFFEEPARGERLIPVVYSHGSAIAQLAAFEMANEFEFAGEPVFWSPAAWWSSATVLGMLFPAWWYGGAVVSLDRALPAGWLKAIEDYAVTNAFMPAEYLGLLREALSHSSGDAVLSLRTIVTNDRIDEEMGLWCEERLGSSVNTVYGWANAQGCIATCRRWFETRPGWLGRSVPGRQVEILDPSGMVADAGALGSIVVRRLERSGSATRGKKVSVELSSEDWVSTGASGLKNDQGEIWLSG